MKASDTVMSLDAFNIWSKVWHSENDVSELYMKAEFLSRWELAKLQHQAEISFKAGIEAERTKHELAYCEKHKLYYCDCCPDCFEEKGRREVVEWMQENSETFETHSGRIIEFNLRKRDWQSQKKEWGV